MRHQEVRDALRKEPFQPFRVQLSNGNTYDVRHPEFAALARHSIWVVTPRDSDDDADRFVQCDLLQVVAMEPINGASDA